MKSVLLPLAVMLFVNDCSKESNQLSKLEHENVLPKIEYLIIYSIDIDILTFSSVDCDDFLEGFGDKMKKTEIINNDKIEKFNKLLTQSITSQSKNSGVDTRIKIFIHYDDDTDKEICCDRFTVYIDNENRNMSKEFLDYLLEITGQIDLSKKYQ